MQNPRVSVAMCTFNGARFVEAQLKSILTQSSPVHQLVVADDGSVDETLEIVRRTVAEAESPVDLVILEEPLRRGVTANFERAIKATDGDIVILCDQDDVWHPERVAIGLAALIGTGMAFHHTDARLVDSEGLDLGFSLFDSLGIDDALRQRIADGGAFPVYLRRNLATGATACFRRELLDVASPFPTEWLHDEWLAVIAAAQGRLTIAESVTIDYRQHSSNQIGVVERTFRNRVRRALAPRGDRTALLAARSLILSARLEEHRVNPVFASEAKDKASFELGRSTLPNRRLARIAPVFRSWRKGHYDRFASQGRLDMIRDLLQPVDTVES